MAHQAGAYPGFCSKKQLGVFLFPPVWDTSPSEGYTKFHLGFEGKKKLKNKFICNFSLKGTGPCFNTDTSNVPYQAFPERRLTGGREGRREGGRRGRGSIAPYFSLGLSCHYLHCKLSLHATLFKEMCKVRKLH